MQSDEQIAQMCLLWYQIDEKDCWNLTFVLEHYSFPLNVCNNRYLSLWLVCNPCHHHPARHSTAPPTPHSHTATAPESEPANTNLPHTATAVVSGSCVPMPRDVLCCAANTQQKNEGAQFRCQVLLTAINPRVHCGRKGGSTHKWS